MTYNESSANPRLREHVTSKKNRREFAEKENTGQIVARLPQAAAMAAETAPATGL